MKDLEIKKIIENERKRQLENVELIASENFVSKDVLEASGSILTNKYAEGYPGKRYYGGCEFVDEIEQLAIDRIKKLFNAGFANVQPHSGSQANFAAYNAVLNSGDRILGMDLFAGGHLTHGFKVSSTSKYFEAFSYGVNKETGRLDFDEIEKIAKKVKPKLIICGASAYSREIEWKKFKEIGEKVNALVLADVAHIAGLIVTGLHSNPLDYGIDIVTSTTHKTLRGARGGIILTNDSEIAQKIDKSVFPATQGGPLMNLIGGKAVAFGEALKKEFKTYQIKVIKNAKAMANYFTERDGVIVTGGTDNHLFLLNVKDTFGITGMRAEELLMQANIVVNKNTIPFDTETPNVSSGIRIGTPAMTTKGWGEKEFIKLSEIIWNILEKNDDNNAIKQKQEIKKLLGKIKK